MHILKRSDGTPRKKRFGAFFLAGFLTLAGVGTAVAYWTIGGSGTGSVATGTTSAVSVVQTSTVTGVYPGDTVALSGDFNNTVNPGSVYITTVTAVVATFSSQSDLTKPACTQGDFAITGTSNTPGEIAHGTGVGSWSGLSITLTDAGTNQDNCENLASVPITYTAS